MFLFGFPLFGASLLVAVLAASRYLLGPEVSAAWVKAVGGAIHEAYAEVKGLVGTVGRRGWRPYIPWCFGAMLTVIVVRLALGLSLPDAGTLAVLLGPLGALTAHSVQCRSADYRAGVANAVNVVRDIANVTFSAPPEGGPRPMQPA